MAFRANGTLLLQRLVANWHAVCGNFDQ